MSEPVLVLVKEDESDRILLSVPASTSQSEESLHQQVERAVRRAHHHQGATAYISYKSGALGVSVSLADALNAARGQPLHPSVQPHAGILEVTAQVDVLPDQPRGGAPGAAASTASAKEQSNGDSSTDALKKAESMVSQGSLALLYPKKLMKHDSLKGSRLGQLGKGNLWQFADRGDSRKSSPLERLAFRAFLKMCLRTSPVRKNPAAGPAKVICHELGR